MRNVTTAFRRTLTDINRKWLPYVDITLLDGTVLPQFTDATLWTTGLSFEDVVSEDEKFTALGAAIMGAATVVIDNTGEKWNDYDFNDADVTIRLGLEVNGAPEVLRIGQYTVAEAKYNGATVTLTLQDYMHQFDRAYDTALVYPATLGVILRDACTNCGVLYDNSLLEFTNNDYTVAEKPDGSNTTYRDVVAWVAQLAGCFAKFNATGKLEFKWFGDDILTAAQQGYDGGEFDPANPYATGDNANGGSFNPWNIGAELDGGALTDNGNCHYIGSLFSETIALDNTVITGVSVSAEREADNGRETVTATSGTTGYVIGIEGNKLLSADDVQTFATYLGTRVIGLTFRKSRVTHLSDPSIEAGDVALLYDHKSREYPILITRTRFTTGGRQETVCGSETPARNRAKQFSQETKNYVDLRRQLKQTKDSWDLAEENLKRQIRESAGLYSTEIEDPVGSGAYKTYYHDKVNLEDSDIVMEFTDYGFTMTSDYQNGEDATWYGIGTDGTGILDVLQTKGVNADWINAGTLQDKNGSNFRLNLETGQTDIKKGSINLGAYTENGTTKYNFTLDDTGKVGIKKGSITLGDKSDTSDTSKYYFDVDTNGHLSWNEQYSSMTANGKFSARDATLSGTITTGSETSGTYTKMSGGSLTFKYNGEEMYTQKGQYFDDSSYHGVALQFADDGDFWAITEYRGSLIKPMLLVSHNPGSNSAARHEHGVYCTVPFFIGASGHRALTGGDPWNAHLYIGTDAEIRLSEDAEGKPSGTYKSGYTGTVGSSVFKKGICVGKTNTDISLDQKLTASNGLDVSSSFSIRNNTDANIYTNVYFHDWNIYDVDIFNGRYNTEWNGATYNGQTFTGNGSPKAVRFTAPDGTYWDAYVVNGIIT